MTCDGLPLLDWRDNDLTLVDPKIRLGANRVGEGTFTIYNNHPHYNKLQLLKSVIEVSDEYGVIFRGRATSDTVDIHNGMTVDIEGALSYFNDSVVRPFKFPEDVKNNAGYIRAAASGNVVEFFLGWLIDKHNSQVMPFQQLQLGRVTVRASNNYFERVDKEHTSTWEALKTSLFDSDLGGYLCIRYEPNGNYVDYLSGFEDTNEQKIVFGENILDIASESSATEIYTAIIPLGSVVEYEVQTGVTEGEFVDFINTKKIEENVTIKSIPDRDVSADLVKSGDTLYSKSGVEKYGWIYAPTNETTWHDVEDAGTLMNKAVEWMTNRGALNHSIEVTAVDLHFTDAQIRSLRMYQNVIVYSKPHGLDETFQISSLEVDLLNPQKTVIEVGKSTFAALTDKTAQKYDQIMSDVDSVRGAVASIKAEAGKVKISAIDTKGALETTIDAQTWEAIRRDLNGETTSGFWFDFENGQFVFDGTGEFRNHDGTNYVTIEGDEMVMYSLDKNTGKYIDKIHFGFISGDNPANSGGTLDYPYMLLGNSGGNVGMIKEFYNGLFIGNSVPKNASGNFNGMAGASGIFVNTRTSTTYVVNGTDLQSVYTGEAVAKFG
jgi:hypothetical protein